MLNNFESWRKAKLERFSSFDDMRYYRISSEVCRNVVQLVQLLLALRVNQQRKRVSFTLSDALANCLLDFLDQLAFAYMHPRSTSARMQFLREQKTVSPNSPT